MANTLQNTPLAGGATEIVSTNECNTHRIVVVDDDDWFRETLALILTGEGYEVTSFSGGAAVLDHFATGGLADMILLHWRMPELNGVEVLRSLRSTGHTMPAIFLTVPSEDIHEAAALEGGSVDFVENSRDLPILIMRVRLIANAARPALGSVGNQSGDVLHLGPLELRFDTNRASWSGTPIPVTAAEFKIIALLALRTGKGVSYREIFDLLHGKSFSVAHGDERYRTDVRVFIKSIRKKLREIDPGREYIQNYAGFGYGYHGSA